VGFILILDLIFSGHGFIALVEIISVFTVFNRYNLL
jgi:hypothetical protein